MRTEAGTMIVHQSNDMCAPSDVSVVFGIVLVSASYALQLLGISMISSGCLVGGLTLLLLPAAFKMVSSNPHWRSSAVYFSLVGSIELLNLMNLREPMAFVVLVQRYICYAICAAGMVYGQRITDDSRRFPGIAHLAVAGFTCLVGGLWLRAAGSAGGIRFVGESDILTPVGVGYSFGILGCVSVAFLFNEQRLIFRAPHLIAYCICFLAILSTGSRGSAVFLLLIAGAGVVVRLRSLNEGLRYSLVFLTIIVVLAVILATNDYARSQLDFMLSRFAFISRGEIDLSIVERQQRRLFYYRSVDSWILLGLRGYNFKYPHNVFLESVLRFGVVGFGLIAAILYSAVRAVKNLRVSQSGALVWVISSVGFFTLLVVQVNLMLEFARCLWLFVGYWGVKEVHNFRFGRLEHEERSADSESEGIISSFGELGSVKPLEEA